MQTYKPHTNPDTSGQINNNKSKSHLFAVFAYHSHRSHYARGFTILETVVALAIITAAVIGPVSLITRGLYSASFFKNKLIAAHLAQEGVELIRAIRENNAICIANGASAWSWDTDFDGSSQKLSASPQNKKTIDAVATIPIPCTSNTTITNPIRGGNCRVDGQELRINGDGQYTHTSGASTIFKRCVWVEEGPGAGEPSTASGPPIPGSDIMDVVSEVIWNERGTQKTFQLKERLYNWK